MSSPDIPSDETPPATKNFGKIARRHRRRKNMTPEDVAARANLSPMGLFFIETGKRNPTMTNAERIAIAVREDFSEMVRESSQEDEQED